MSKKRAADPLIHIDDLHPNSDGFGQSYKATWQEAGVIASIWLEVVDHHHWRPGHYWPNAYELSSHVGTVSGRPPGAIQEETGYGTDVSPLSREQKTGCFFANQSGVGTKNRAS